MSKNPPFINEEEKLRIHLNRTHTERFRMLMKLIKITEKLKKAAVSNPKL